MNQFSKILLIWHKNKLPRNMPWLGEKDPYLVWLSEIILQQTRVEQGLSYYLRFREKYPTVHHLAAAKDDDVMKDWQGLGYYSRARNLLATARIVVADYNGVFPDKKAELLKLKGVGDYTVAAILSFCFNKREAVVDGNVIRVLSRYFGVYTLVDTSQGKNEIKAIAQELIPDKEPGGYNQAIMDFGALVCKPRNPHCMECPLNQDCIAFRSGKSDKLPVQSKKAVKKVRFFNYLVPRFNQFYYIRKRSKNDIWKGLYEFPYAEAEKSFNIADTKKFIRNERTFGAVQFDIKNSGFTFKQILSHQIIHSTFHFIELKDDTGMLKGDTIKVDLQELNNFAYSKTIDWFLKQNRIYL